MCTTVCLQCVKLCCGVQQQSVLFIFASYSVSHSAAENLGSFQALVINSTAMNILVYAFCKYIVVFLLCIYLGVEFLSHYMCSDLEEISKVFPRSLCQQT
jgi:hypothetical protein